MPDYDDMSMLELFKLECDDLMKELNSLILALENAEQAAANLDSIARIIHTIKGSSKAVMIDEISMFAHAVEDHLQRLRGREAVTAGDVDYLLTITDWINHLIRLAVEEKPFPSDINRLVQAVSKSEVLEPPVPGSEDLPSEESQSPSDRESTPLGVVKKLSPAVRKDNVANTHLERARGSQRITTRSLESLFNLAGELYVRNNRVDEIKNDLFGLMNTAGFLARRCKALAATFSDSKSAAKNGEEANLGRLVEEISQKSDDLQHGLGPLYQDLDEFNTQFRYLTTALQEEVMEARMVPLSQLFETFPRMVRELSKSLGKKVHLEINGSDTRLDKAVIEALKVPLDHLVRNAVDHGIESDAIRQSRGKPPEGTLSLSAYQWGDDVIVRLVDDGQGIDPNLIRSKIVIQKRLSEGQAAKLQDAELMEFVFLPGFSTRDQAGDYSGRGVGMDVVRTEIERIGGHVLVESIVGQSTSLTLRLPLSLAITNTLLMEANRQIYAFPTSLVEGYLTICPREIQSIGGKQVYNYQDQILAVAWLSQLMGGETGHLNPERFFPALLFQMGDTRVAIIADHFMGNGEIVVKPLDPRLKKVQNIAGATIAPDGRINLVIDTTDILNSVRESYYIDDTSKAETTESTEVSKQILVVEDSLTIREMQKKLLRNAGYDVTLAVDGIDGLNKVKLQPFDLIISDIDMPRMNGLELTKALKSEEKYRHIPLVIVSYKDRSEDKQKGLEAGADHYITKGHFDSDEFLQLIARLV